MKFRVLHLILVRALSISLKYVAENGMKMIIIRFKVKLNKPKTKMKQS